MPAVIEVSSGQTLHTTLSAATLVALFKPSGASMKWVDIPLVQGGTVTINVNNVTGFREIP